MGLFAPTPAKVKQERAKRKPKAAITVDLLNCAVVAVHTADGLRALSKNKPIDPASVERYLKSKFGGGLDDTRNAMGSLARSRGRLTKEAHTLYEEFRPEIPGGSKAGERKDA